MPLEPLLERRSTSGKRKPAAGAARTMLTAQFVAVDGQGRWHTIHEYTDHVATERGWRAEAKHFEDEDGSLVCELEEGVFLLLPGTIALRTE